MKQIISILITVFIVNIGLTQVRDTVYLWSKKVPGELEKKHPPKQTDNTSGNVIRLTNVTNPRLTVYKPEKSNHTGAGIIICPGGGYNILAINKEGYEIAAWLNSLGYTAFVLEYRVPEKQGGALQDLKRAIKIVRNYAVKYEIDDEKIGVIGFSAGGHLAAYATTNCNTNSYENVDEADKLSSCLDFAMLIYPAYLDKGKERSISPELTIKKNNIPFFVFATADDKYANSALTITKALRDNNISVEMHLLPKGGHGYGLRKGIKAAETWPILAESWLDEILSK